MKRIINILGVIAIGALLLGGGAVLPVVATPGVTVSIDAPAGVAPGSDFTANVSISEVTDFDACQYDVSFDASVLRLDDVTSGLVGSTKIPVDIYSAVSTETWRVVQNVPGLAGASGSGYLAELHFHVVGSAGDSSVVGPSNGVLSDIVASEIEATWMGGSVEVAAEASQATTPPPAANLSPEATPPDETAPSPAEPINWPVLWKVIGGVVVVGLITLLLARRRAY